jgi:hypothetical protein
MSLGDVWIRGKGPDVEIGRFRPAQSGIVVSWNGAEDRTVQHQPPDAVTVTEGSLRFEALTRPEDLAARYKRAPLAVIHELLKEAGGRPLDAEAILWRLTKELELTSVAARSGLKSALPALRNDPNVVYDPVPEAPTFHWTSTPVEPDPHAELRLRPWRHLAVELFERTLSPEDSDILLERALQDPPTEPHAALVAAVLGIADWPEPAAVLAAASDRRRMVLFTELNEKAMLRLRNEARSHGRTDVLWLLAGVPRSSKALRGLAQDLEPVDPELPFPALVIDALARRQTATVGKSLSIKLVTEILERIPPCPASGVQYALRDLARTAQDRQFRALIASRPELGGGGAPAAVQPAAPPDDSDPEPADAPPAGT